MEQAPLSSQFHIAGCDRRRPGRTNYKNPSLIKLLRRDFANDPALDRESIVPVDDATPSGDATPLALLFVALWAGTIVLAVMLSP